MKKLLAVLVVLGMCTGLVWAWSDSFTVTVTPSGNRGVIIGSSTYDAGVMANDESKISDAIPVTSTGTISPIEYTIQGANATDWSLTADGDVTPIQDELCLQALFQATATQPGGGSFGTDDTISTGAQQVGDGAPGEFEGTSDMDDLGLLETHYLYLQLTAPPSSSTESEQTFTVTIDAEAAD